MNTNRVFLDTAQWEAAGFQCIWGLCWKPVATGRSGQFDHKGKYCLALSKAKILTRVNSSREHSSGNTTPLLWCLLGLLLCLVAWHHCQVAFCHLALSGLRIHSKNWRKLWYRLNCPQLRYYEPNVWATFAPVWLSLFASNTSLAECFFRAQLTHWWPGDPCWKQTQQQDGPGNKVSCRWNQCGAVSAVATGPVGFLIARSSVYVLVIQMDKRFKFSGRSQCPLWAALQCHWRWESPMCVSCSEPHLNFTSKAQSCDTKPDRHKHGWVLSHLSLQTKFSRLRRNDMHPSSNAFRVKLSEICSSALHGGDGIMWGAQQDLIVFLSKWITLILQR